MYRRIQLINHFNKRFTKWDEPKQSHIIHGLMGFTTKEVADAWVTKLNGPDRTIPSNAHFYFTEQGWENVGRYVVEACIKSGQEYKVIKVKENSVNVVWKDEYEVAAQMKKSSRVST